ncbi:MAG: YgjV family protein [Clostridia bacterium]|nr:YgjV family protein [Clostridia bacterium]
MANLLFSGLELINVLSNALGVWYLVIINTFGVGAIICKILEYQVKSRNSMFMLTTIANVCWVLYFVLYGNFASSLTCLINVIKMLIFMQRGKRKWAESTWWLILFLVLQILVTIFIVSTWVDVFCIIAGFLGVFAYFFKDAKVYRLLSFFHMAFWVANSIANAYLIALLSDAFSTVSCGIAIFRYDILAKKSSAREDEEQSSSSNVDKKIK